MVLGRLLKEPFYIISKIVASELLILKNGFKVLATTVER